jgi:hypothetical protein
MPVTKIQSKIARLLSQNRSPDSYLAGGAALHFEPNTVRYSHDLDYFHDSEERVASAFFDDHALLIKNGFELSIEMRQPGFIRSIVAKGNQQTKVEWSHDSAWRFMPTLFFPDRGYTLHPIDLAINKVLTLAGRDEVRDYIDVHEAHIRILPLPGLCWAACSKDPGFTPHSLLELLRRRGKYQPEDFLRLRLNRKMNLPDLKTKWLGMLEDTDIFIRKRPPNEVGCLYYSTSRERFVMPTADLPEKDIVPHYGSLGGVLPKIGDIS